MFFRLLRKIDEKNFFTVYFEKIDFNEIFGFLDRFLMKRSEKVQKYLFFIYLHTFYSIPPTNLHANLFLFEFWEFEF